jgi:hypothetical protein
MMTRGDAKTDILIVGGGTGGCAAAIAATSLGRKVILTEETDWIGGQLTAQCVPPDEHSWIEQFGRTSRYADYRRLVRDYYRTHYPLTPDARADRYLNPGNGLVSRLCHEFRVGLAVLEQMLAPARSAGLLEIRLERAPVAVQMAGDRVRSVTLKHLPSGASETIEADLVLDATELGDLLPLAGVEYVVGFESQRETGEPHAKEGDPEPDNVQAFSWVFAMGYDPEGEHVIEKPSQFERWKSYVPPTKPEWPFPLFTWDRALTSKSSFDSSAGHGTGAFSVEKRVLFPHEADSPQRAWFPWRRLVYPGHYPPGVMPYEIVSVIWTQNDYMGGNIIDKPEEEAARYLEESRQQSLSFLYWMQTEAPRPDGGQGYPGLFPAPEITGTEDGLAKYPYIREARRIRALLTVTENHIGADAREDRPAEPFDDSVGVGCYHIDLHYSSGGDHGIHMDCLPFQIPLRALIPVRVENLLPAGKNLGVTHLTNGSFRLHPVEWNAGEAAGLLAAYSVSKDLPPRAVAEKEELLGDFQRLCLAQGFELEWPSVTREDGWSAFDKRVVGRLPQSAIPRRK